VSELKPSKSARKREYLAVQKLGEELISLKRSDLEQLELDDDLLQAILAAAVIKSHSALRRQKQYIGKLMRHLDPEPIRAGLASIRRR
jgi:ribosome-associated protein